MNALIKEEQKMDHLEKSYLQLYQEFISGYKQYKMEKEPTRNTETVDGQSGHEGSTLH